MNKRIGFLAPIVWLAVQPLLASEARAECPTTAVRYASSSNRIYVTGPASCSLTEITAKAPSTALQLVDAANKVWLLRANLVLEKGGELRLYGSGAGGDVDWLRLKSNDTSGGTIYVRADHGTIRIASTKITSWDESANGPDTRPTSNGRSYIHVRSRLASDGVTANESRMDISDSEIAYLGYYSAEAYGLVWKVSGSGTGLYDKVNVHGDVTNSSIHHNYFGAYTYGAHDMTWDGNDIFSNHQYGLDPHDDSDFLTVTNNDFHGNGNHGFICSQRCNDLVIRGNRSYNNKGNGFMIHRRVTDTLLEDNEAYGNTDSGIAVFDSSGNTIQFNYLHDNSRGIRFSVGASDNVVASNVIEDNSTYAMYFYKGSDAPSSGDGKPRNNTFTANSIVGNAQAMKLGLSDDNQFIDNTFANNAKGFELTDGQNNQFVGNTIPANSTIYTRTSSLSQALTIISAASTPLSVRSGGGGVTRFVETAGYSHFVSGQNLVTTVTPADATLSLTSSQAGSAVTVGAVRLYAAPTSGTLLLTPTSAATAWSARSSSGTLTVQYTVGGLAASTTYQVRKNGATIASVTTNGGGVLQFTDDSVGTSSAAYSVSL